MVGSNRRFGSNRDGRGNRREEMREKEKRGNFREGFESTRERINSR